MRLIINPSASEALCFERDFHLCCRCFVPVIAEMRQNLDPVFRCIRLFLFSLMLGTMPSSIPLVVSLSSSLYRVMF